MSETYRTPQEAEDAFYDALDEADLNRMLSVWAEADDIACLLPMHPLMRGRSDVTDQFNQLFSQGHRVSLAITHLEWIETADMAIHLVEETLQNLPTGTPPQPPMYGMNAYRKDADGWRLVLHQNAPTPPPPGLDMPDGS